MVDIILELTFINDVVNFLTNTLNSTINTYLSNNILIMLTLSNLQRLVDWLRAVSNDIFQFERAQVSPFGLDDSQSNTRRDIGIRLIGACCLILVHDRLSSHSVFSKEWRSLGSSTLSERIINLIEFLIHW